jgi:chromatin remodeling complex protein RSC6
MPKTTKSAKTEEVVEVKVQSPVKEEKAKKSRKESKEPATPAPVVETVVVEEKKSRKSKKVEVEAVPEPEPTPVVEVTEVAPEVEGDGERRKRRQVTRDSVDTDFKSVMDVVSSMVSDLSDKKQVSLRVVKRLQKSLTTLHNDSLKVCKIKNHTRRVENPESGFMKPVKISKELSSFTGWNPEELRSRVEVTKYICDYIRQKNLQNPADRRQFSLDPQLSKLLSHDTTKEGPLTYPGLQQRLQTHFTKV